MFTKISFHSSDELPVQLQLPRPLREAKSRHQLSSLTLLGQEFWGYPMANPKNYPNNVTSPSQLTNGVMPMAVTPSDTGSSLSSFNASKFIIFFIALSMLPFYRFNRFS